MRARYTLAVTIEHDPSVTSESLEHELARAVKQGIKQEVWSVQEVSVFDVRLVASDPKTGEKGWKLDA
jgi:hypothetical protein